MVEVPPFPKSDWHSSRICCGSRIPASGKKRISSGNPRVPWPCSPERWKADVSKELQLEATSPGPAVLHRSCNWERQLRRQDPTWSHMIPMFRSHVNQPTVGSGRCWCVYRWDRSICTAHRSTAWRWRKIITGTGKEPCFRNQQS